MSNPLVAEVKDSTQSFTGVPLLESVNDTSQAIASGDWAGGVMGAVGTAMDAASMAMDPFGAILSAGVGWLMEHVGPLKEALDALAGSPDEIKAHSETWKNIATELGDVSADLGQLVTSDTESWKGPGGDAYRTRGADTANLVAAAQSAADGASSGIGTAGEVVSAVRGLVRDIIAELVGHMISWALQVLFTLGIGMAWVVPQVIAAVAKTATKIADITTKLVRALSKLAPMLSKLGGSFGDATKALKNIKASKPPAGKGINDAKGGNGSTSSSSSKGIDSTDTDPPSRPGTPPPSTSNSTPPPNTSSTPPPANTGSGTTPSNAGGSTSTPSNSSSTGNNPSGSTNPNSSPTTWVQGKDTNGNPVSFTSNQAHSIPLKDSNGNVVGISYPTKADDVQKVSKWANRPNRTSDNSFIPDHTPNAHTDPARIKPAPWNSQPFYVHAHANPKTFSVNVNTAPPGAPDNFVKVRLDGPNHGKLVSSNSHFQQASGADPNRPVVYMSCQSGSPSGNAAAGSASQVHSAGHSGSVYAPTGTGVRRPDGNDSYYGVKPGVDSSGNTVPGEFKPF